ncbi:DNA replication helicase dna2 isoform 2 [Dorcoceras hygrometricum]|uniref:DNA replication helicase dna2 isoform 2 n=1 Tax=Dorcoceras hygrometricum TaxID=472368 RepID=A0A2Z7CHT3_9LAMI|nr:DNA replication helicase dna2 isoform 2 [Dorcoceras hygrometricum]
MYIIAKYREMLLSKFLEDHRQNFKAGQPMTAIDIQIIALLSDAHLFALETLQTQMRIHGLKWEWICSSRLFEGENRDRGAVIAHSNTNNRSSCWIRTMTLVNGSWVIQEGGGKAVAAKVHSLLLMIVVDLVLVMEEADLAEVVGVNLRVKDITEVVVLTKDQEEALDTG